MFKLPARGPAPAATSAMGPLVGIAYALRQELNLSHAAVGLDIQMEVCCARRPRKGHEQRVHVGRGNGTSSVLKLAVVHSAFLWWPWRHTSNKDL